MQRVVQFLQTKTGLFLFGMVELALAYGTASWAIDSGNLLLYAATLLLIVDAVHNFVRMTGRAARGQ